MRRTEGKGTGEGQPKYASVCDVAGPCRALDGFARGFSTKMTLKILVDNDIEQMDPFLRDFVDICPSPKAMALLKKPS